MFEDLKNTDLPDIRVIGTGFGRTGTDSMRNALNMLGFGPCHHMRSLVRDQDHKMDWRRYIAGGTPDWRVLLGGYRSCVDWPTAHFWPELIELFPEAKVLLTYRDADSWWKSFSNTILKVIEADTDTEEAQPGSQLIAAYVFDGKPLEREHCIATYEANVARVKSTVPTERLLVHKIGDGWDPLCAFLDVAVPDAPYPSSNNTAEFKRGFSVENDGS